MTVSDVGRMAMGSSRSEFPLFLDQYIVNSTKRQNVRSRDPSYLRRKAFYVVLFTFQNRRRHEHRKIGVLDSKLLNLNIEPSWAKLVTQVVRLWTRPTLYFFPNTVRPGLQDITTTDTVIIYHVGLE